MVRVAPINLQYNPRTLWFDPGRLDVKKGDSVVVLTARGVEFGHMAGDVFEVEQDEIKKLKCALKPVKRIATEKDEEKAREMERKSAEALPVFKEMVAEIGEENMRPIAVEYLLEGDKAVFFFESEERVDFRDLVRKLAAKLHVRIDMRQIGVRDEARLVGGYGHCGQELCCRRLGGGFCPVSIRMAKEQDLSLNPQKISGVCGRLMCCLRYEFEAYKDFKSRAPKQNGTVQTPDGPAKVVELDVPREIVSLKVEGEKAVKVPLESIEKHGDAQRPNYVGEEAWEQAKAQAVMPMTGAQAFSTSLFTQGDKLARAGSVRHTGGGKGKCGEAAGSRAGGASGKTSRAAAKSGSSRKPRRRRSTKLGASEEAQDAASAQSGRQKQQGQGQGQGATRKKQGVKKGKAKNPHAQTASRGAGGAQASRGAASSQNAARGAAQASRGAGGAQSADRGREATKQGPRPGHRSSGLRQNQPFRNADGAHASSAPRQGASFAPSGSAAGAGSATGAVGAAASAAPTEHRRTKRRSHKAQGASAPTANSGSSASVPVSSGLSTAAQREDAARKRRGGDTGGVR